MKKVYPLVLLVLLLLAIKHAVSGIVLSVLFSLLATVSFYIPTLFITSKFNNSLRKSVTFIIILLVTNFSLLSNVFGQIALRGTATTASNSGNNLTINKPTGVVAGDVMIVNINKYSTNTTPTLSGWTLITGPATLGGSNYGFLLYRVADGTEGASFTFALGTTTYGSGTIVAFSGVNVTGGYLVTGALGGPFDVTPGSISTTGASASSQTVTAITTNTANAAVIMFGMNGSTSTQRTYSGWTTTSPGALTEIYDNPGATYLETGAAWGTKATAGSTGSGSFNLSGACYVGGILIALRPLLPTITSFSPTSGCANTTSVTITGTNLSSTSAVTIGGTAAIITGTTSTTVTVTVGSGTTGTIKVTTPAGSVTSAGTFTVNALPTITTSGTASAVCYSASAQTTSLNYSATTGSPTSYSIAWTGLANQGSTSFAFVSAGGTVNNIAIPAGTAAGTYLGTMTITNANGCTNTQVVSVAVNALPTITTSGTATAVCYSASAQTTSLTYSATTGSPTSYSIVWTGITNQGNTAFAFASGGGTINNIAIPAGTAAGTYSGTMTITNANGCTNSQAVSVTVNQQSTNPTSATATSTTICNGGSTSLSLVGGGGGTGTVIHWYTGSCGGTSVGTGNSLSVSPTTTTTYYGRYEDPSPCSTNTTCATVTITVNQKSTNPTSATATSTTICNGGSTSLSLVGGGGGTGTVVHWYTGSCGGTSVGTGNSLSVSPTTTTTYYGRYEDPSPCGTNTTCASITITVNQQSTNPTSATATSTTICNGGSTSLSLVGGGGGTGTMIHWYTGSCGGTSVGTGNSLSVSPTTTTTYYGRYEDPSPCSTNTTCATVTITVNQKSSNPTSATATSTTICNGGSTLLSLVGGGGGTGTVIHWYTGSCGGTSVGTGNSLSVSPTTTTTYYGRYEDPLPCGTNTTCASITITVNQQSTNPTSATATSTTICNGGSTLLSLVGGGGGTGTVIHWYTGSCGGTSVGTGNSLSVSPTTTTTYYGRYEDPSPCSTNTACATVTVNVTPLPTVNAGSAPTAICQGGTSVALGGSIGGSATGGIWDDGGVGGTFSPNNTTLNATWTPPGTYSGTAILTLTATGSSCGSPTSSTTELVYATPTANAGAALAAICQGGTSASLGGSVTGSATGGIWDDGGVGGTFSPNNTTLNATWTPPSTYYGTATLTLTASGSSCGNPTSSKTELVYQTPTTANAGPDQTDISTCGLTSVTLAANTPVVGTGMWSIISGTGGSFVDPTNPTTTFDGVAGNSYTLSWTITNGTCTSVSTVNITFNINPTTAIAGPDQTGASTCGLTTVTLAGNTPSFGTGSWSILSGTGGSFGNASSPTSTFTGIAGNTYLLQWTISSPCGSSSSTVNITFNQNPTTANAGPNQTGTATCGLTTVTLAGNIPTIGNGLWSIVSGTGGSFTDPTNPATTFSGVAGNTYVLQWTISNSPCTSSSSNVTITFNQNPTIANAGSNQTGTATCGLTTVTLAGNTPTIGTGLWSIISGTGGSFANSSNPTTTFSGVAGNTYVLQWTISNSPCTSSSSNDTIIFSQVPSVTNAASVSTCSGTSPNISLTASTSSTFTWTVGTITGSITGASSGSGSAINQVLTNPSNTTAGTVQYIVTPTSTGGLCTGSAYTITVTVNPTPVVTNLSTASTCSGSGPNISLTSSVPGSFAWTIGTITGSITGASNASGSTINQTLTNPSNTTAGSVVYNVTPTATTGSCAGSAFAITVTVNPKPALTNGSTASTCSGTGPNITLSSSTLGTSTYAWTLGTITGGITGATAGSGATINQTLTDPSNATSGTVPYNVTPTSSFGCVGAASTITVTVNPIPAVTTANTKATCSGTSPNISLTASTASTFSWTVGAITGGITGANNGSGSTISDVLTNPSNTTAGTVQYIVTPTSTGGLCTGSAYTITVTVNPTPVVTNVSTASTCSGVGPNISLTSSVPGSFAWTIGTITGSITGASNASGSTINQVLTNPSNTTAGSVVYNVTPTATTGSCAGSAFAITVTVNPKPVLTNGSTASTCSGTGPNITLSSSTSGTSTYAWTIGTITGGITGASAASGSTINQTLTDPSNATSGTVPYNVTPTSALGCVGAASTITVTVNPIPAVTTASTASTCSGTSPNISLTASTSSTFTWTVGTITGSITGASSGSGSAINQVLTNPSNTTAGTVQYIVTPTSTGGLCTGSAYTITVTVNPTPVVTNLSTASTCSGSGPNISLTSSVPGSFAWTIGTITGSITGASNASGSTINQTLTNPSNATAGSVVYNVTPTATTGSCAGSAFAITVTVNPKPALTNGSTTSTCSGTGPNITLSSSTSGTSTYAWTIGTITGGITGASAASGSTINQTLTNPSNATAGTVPYNVTPTSSFGCVGGASTITVTVNPKPAVTTSATASTCSGTSPNISLTASTSSTFTWTVGTITGSIIGASAGSGSTINQTLANPSNTTPGTVQYIVTPISASGCTGSAYTITVTVNPVPLATITANYCYGGGNVQLTASAGSSYLWSTGATTQSVLVNLAGSYTVTVNNSYGCSATNNINVAQELVTNGTFSAGNTGFTSSYSYNPAFYTGGTTGLWDEGLYAVGSNANNYHPDFFGTAITPGQNFMIINGADGTTYPTVWQETVTVNPNTTYYFSAWGMSMNNVGNYAQLQFNVNGAQVGTTDTLTAGASSTAGPFNWTEFYGTWNSGSATTAVISIVDLQNAASGNDFGLDDISFGTLSPVSFAASPSGNGGSTVCVGNTLTLNANITGGSSPFTYSWTGPNSFTSNVQNPTISNVTTANSGTYTLSATDYYGCPVTATTTITVNPLPSVSNQTTTACSGVAFSVTPSGTPTGTTYTWTAPTGSGFTGGSAQATGQTSISQTLTNTTASPVTATYTVTPTSGAGCAGNSFTVTVTINPAPTMTSASSATICSGGTVSIPLTSNIASTYTWIATNNPNTTGESTTTQTTSTLSNTITSSITTSTNVIYTVTPTSTPFGCAGTPQTVNVTVSPTPAVTNKTATICSGATFTVTPTGVPAGTTYTWTAPTGSGFTGGSAQSTGQSSISQTLTNTTTSAVTATYTVTPTSGSCPGSTFTVTVTVNPNPTMTSASSATICSGGTVSIPLTSNIASTFTWIAANNPNTTGESTTTQTTSTLSNTITNNATTAQNVIYTVTPTSTGGGCAGTSQTVTVTVNPLPTITGILNVCAGSTTQLTGSATAAASNPWVSGSTGIATISNTGLVTGVAAGTSIITYTNNNGCSITATVTVNGLPTISSDVATPATICNGSSSNLVVTAAGGTTTSTIVNYDFNTGTSYTALTPTLATNITSTVSGSATFGTTTGIASGGNAFTTNSTAGNALTTVPNKTWIFTLGGTALSSYSTFQVYYQVSRNTGGSNTITMAYSLNGGAYTSTGITATVGANPVNITSSGTWYEALLTLPVAANNPTTSLAFQLTVANTGTGNVQIDNFQVQATQPSNTYSWIASPPGASAGLPGSAGSALTTNNNITVSPTTTTNYTVTVTNGNGCQQNSNVTVTVNPVSVAGSISGAATVCTGINSTTLTLSGYTGTIQWQSSPDNSTWSNISGATSASYTATNLTGTTYYRVVVTSGVCSSSTSSSVTVTVNPVSVAGSISGTATVCTGTNSTTLTLSGNTGTIQWQSSPDNSTWSNIGGATSSTYTATNLTATTYYRVIVTSGVCSSSSSSSVTVTVNPASVSGSISGAATVCTGTNSTILTLSGNTGTIQWQSSPNNTSWTNISGATSSTYTTTNLTATTYYRVIVTSGVCSSSSSSSVTVTVNPASVPGSISGAATVCTGTNSTTLTLSGNTGTIQWQSSPDNSTWSNIGGATSSTYTATNLTATTYYRVVVTNGVCSSSISSSAIITVNNYRSWLGVNTNWFDASNWCGGVPTSSTNVLIPAGLTYYPNITSGTAITNNISIQSGASVIVNSAAMQIYGSISNTGTFDATQGTIELNGSVAQTIDGSMFAQNTINNLTISNTSLAGVSVAATALDTLKISGALAFGNVDNAVFNTNDNLSLLSTTLATARVADITNAGVNSGNSINGKVTIERYIQAHRAWRLLTAPINSPQTINSSWQEGYATTTPANLQPAATINVGYGTEITNTIATVPGLSGTGYDAAVTNNPSIKYLTSSGWTVPSNTNSTNVNSQQGFMLFVRGDRTVVVTTPPFQNATPTVLRVHGTLNQNDNVIPIATTGFQILGNPFASEVNLDNMFAAYGGLLGSNYYLWDPLMTGTQGVGAFFAVSYDGSAGEYSSSAHVSPFIDGKIESSEAFLFNFSYTGNIAFHETDKDVQSALVFRPVNNSSNQNLRINLHTLNSDGSTFLDDGTLLILGNQFSNSVNWLQDAQKITNPSENISLVSNGKTMAIEKRQPLTVNDTIYIKITQMQQQAYQLQLLPNGLAQTGLTATLLDSFMHTATPVSLSDTTKINFTVTADAASQGANRFRIVFNSVGGIVPVTYTSIKASQQNNTNNIEVQWQVQNQVNIKQYIVEKSTDGYNFNEVTSVAVTPGNLTTATYNWLDINASVGNNFYRIKNINIDGTVQYSSIVKVAIAPGISRISVYPNPVVNGEIGLQFNNMPKNIYNIRLLNPLGQVILSEEVNHPGGSATETIPMGKNLAKGSYQLEVVSPDNSKTVIQVLN